MAVAIEHYARGKKVRHHLCRSLLEVVWHDSVDDEIRESLEGYLVFSERFSVRVRCLVYEPEPIMMRHSIGSVQEICCGLFVAFACGGQTRHEYDVDLVSIPFGTRRASIHAKPPNPKVWCDY